MNRDLRNALLFSLLTALCVLATVPMLEMGVNDDWSYTRSARDLAVTGHLVYFGWASAMVGSQALWAALFIKLFGFSFTLVRLTTLPLVVGCALLLYALGRRAGLSPSLSAFGMLSVVLSPLFVPLAASFMTDVPGFFYLLACVYCLTRVLEDEGTKARGGIGWLALAAAAGVLGSTTRQTVGVAPLVLLPYAAWVRRRDGRIVAAAAALWSAAAAAIAVCMLWFNAQPNVVPENPLDGIRMLLHGFPQSLLSLLPFVFSTALFVLPVFLGTLGLWRPVLKINGALLALLFLIWIVRPFPSFDYARAPWTHNIVTPWGITEPGVIAIGMKPQTLPFVVCAVLSLAVYALLTLVSLALMQRLAGRQGTNEARETPPAPPVVRLLTLFVIFYIPLLAPRAFQHLAFDRYLIPILPVAILPLLVHYQRRVGPRPHAAGWVLTALFALYGIATTHDYLATSRARLASATALAAVGVPRTQISAGFEYDGWTQVDATGAVALPNGRHGSPNPPNLPVAFWFWRWTPALTPRYLVVLSRQPGLRESAFPPFPYTTWLPPFHRQVLIQTAP